MIAVRLMGGLGNQMFQYAAARQLANNVGTDVVFDFLFFENLNPEDTPRHYELDCFNLEVPVLSASERPVERDAAYYSGTKGRLKKFRDRVKGQNWTIYNEPHHNFDPKLLKLPDKTYLIGYWQTEKYFIDSRDQILKDFSYRKEPNDKNKQLKSGCQLLERFHL